MDTCVCGDGKDEHGGAPEFPGSTACNEDGCDCVAFEIYGCGCSDEDGPCSRHEVDAEGQRGSEAADALRDSQAEAQRLK